MSAGLYFYECIVSAQQHRLDEEKQQQAQQRQANKQHLQRVRNQLLFAANSAKKLSK